MEEKTVFSNAIVYWVIVGSLVVGLIFSGYALVNGFNLLAAIHLAWIAVLLFLVLIKHKSALANLKWWLIISVIAGPALSVAGRLLNEILDDSSSFSVEFYLYRALSIIIGLIMLNHIRNTITVEKTKVS